MLYNLYNNKNHQHLLSPPHYERSRLEKKKRFKYKDWTVQTQFSLWKANGAVLLIRDSLSVAENYLKKKKLGRERKQVILCGGSRLRDSQHWHREQVQNTLLKKATFSLVNTDKCLSSTAHSICLVKPLTSEKFNASRNTQHTRREDNLLAICIWCSCIVQWGTAPLIKVIDTGSRSHKCKQALIITVGSSIVQWCSSNNNKKKSRNTWLK